MAAAISAGSSATTQSTPGRTGNPLNPTVVPTTGTPAANASSALMREPDPSSRGTTATAAAE
jgi:hypothetical protein